MSDLDTLRTAFAELERRADAADLPDRDHAPSAGTGRGRWVLIAASVAVVAGVAAGIAVLTGGSDDTAPAAAPPSVRASAPPATSPTPAPARTTATPTVVSVPKTADEMAKRLRAVLGSTATFTSPQSGPDDGNNLTGRITDTKTGITGSFDLQATSATRKDEPICEDAEESHCKIRTLADGSRVSVGQESSQMQRGGRLILVNLIRRDGIGFLFHVSNEGNAKGGEGILGPKPPFTADRMIRILQSDRW